MVLDPPGGMEVESWLAPHEPDEEAVTYTSVTWSGVELTTVREALAGGGGAPPPPPPHPATARASNASDVRNIRVMTLNGAPGGEGKDRRGKVPAARTRSVTGGAARAGPEGRTTEREDVTDREFTPERGEMPSHGDRTRCVRGSRAGGPRCSPLRLQVQQLALPFQLGGAAPPAHAAVNGAPWSSQVSPSD